ncbi:MAG TPA: hypothetical protein VFF06_04585 [Polyangia bacterium]|nr:hypothetical protein [Polyangia bacterium]
MLVIVSDLHLCDGTAYPQNVTAASFGLLQSDIYSLAKRYNAKNLDLVFLGDVFDLLRTERWFEDDAGKPVAMGERPWGYDGAIDGKRPPDATLARARAILDGIVARNLDVLAALRGEATGLEAPCPVRRIYLPGNHDRLYLFDDQLRARVQTALGATDERSLAAEGIFQHRLAMPRYGLLARHGHEWDRLNFQAFRKDAVPADYTDAEYLQTPIGDPITTELVAALPYELERRLRDAPDFKGTPMLAHVRDRMEKIEDVRPLMAALEWPFYEAERLQAHLTTAQHDVLRAALRDTVHTLATRFVELPYFKQWRDRTGGGLGFELALDALRVIDPTSLGSLKSVIAKLVQYFQGEDLVSQGAAREDLAKVGTSGLRFVVYGHTHNPDEVALRADGTDDVYLNSGTWRRREFMTLDQRGFIGWEQFTYLAFYDAGERGPAYECWSGTRR